MNTNRQILVDNATLSGVERLLGYSQIINLNKIDNDILCLEKLLTAILFSDKLVGVDDYKDEYRSKRIRNFEFVEFLKIEQQVHNRLSEEAARFAKSMIFSFDDSKPAGDVLSFFEALRLDPQLRWDVFVSSEYLTLSLLVGDTREVRYEAAIDSVFRNEIDGADAAIKGADLTPAISVRGHPEIAELKDLVQALKAGNANFSGNSSNSLLARCIFGYGWAAERSHFYNAVAEMQGADAFLAPLRDAFCESCCRIESSSQVNSLLERLKSHSQETISSIVEASGRAKFVMKLPFFTASLISKADNPLQCIELALEWRSRSDFRDCRTILHNLSHLSNQDRYGEVNKILRLLEKYCESMLKKYGISAGGRFPISLSLGLSGLSAGTSIKLDSLFSPYRNKPFARIFRNISQDMLNIERLGGLYEKLCSSIVEHEKAMHPKISTTPKFMETKESTYGRPVKF